MPCEPATCDAQGTRLCTQRGTQLQRTSIEPLGDACYHASRLRFRTVAVEFDPGCALAGAWRTSPMTTPSEGTFGDVLRRLRKAAGLTQGELAERAGLSPRGLNDLERGER